MLVNSVNICDGACRMFIIETNKFKFSSLSVLACLDGIKTDVAYESMLLGVLSRGTDKHRTLSELNRHLDTLYSMTLGTRRHRFCSNHFLSAGIEYLDKRYTYDNAELEEAGVGVIKELLFEPLLDGNGLFLEAYVESEKQNLINALNSRKNNPRAYAASLCKELMSRDEPGFMSVDNTLERIAGITAASLTDYYRKALSACGFICFYVGNAPERAIKAVENMMQSLKHEGRLGKLPAHFTIDPPHIPNGVTELNVPIEVSQCKLSVGYRTPSVLGSPDATVEQIYATQVLNEIFGGGASSKLFLNVREAKGLCYYCGSSYSLYSGALYVNSGIDSADRALVESEIDAQLESIRQGNITEEELENAKRSLRFSYTQITDNTEALENFYLWRSLFSNTASHTAVIDGIMRVTAEDVARAAQRVVKCACVCIDAPVAEGRQDINE